MRLQKVTRTSVITIFITKGNKWDHKKWPEHRSLQLLLQKVTNEITKSDYNTGTNDHYKIVCNENHPSVTFVIKVVSNHPNFPTVEIFT